MDALLAARVQMEVSLAFHMVFAALGIGLPLLMVIAEGLWLRTGREHYRDLARTWAKATALTFAVGAVSGTALSFELGLLWPRFMEVAGGVLGPAFALEGYAFFIEAIFLGLYLYGWDRLSPRAHWLTGIPVALSGLLSGILVVAANAWMQTPTGIEGLTAPGLEITDPAATGPLAITDALAVFRSPAWFQMALHSSLSCYIATGFATAGVYALGILKGRTDAYHRAGLTLALALGGVTALLQPISGDISARFIAEHQPAKLAAAEAHYETEAGAPLTIGGIPTGDGEVILGLEIPYGLSLLAHHDPNAEVIGLDAFPEDERPNVLITHLAFQVMVGLGFAMIAVALWFWWVRWRRPDSLPYRRRLLRTILIASPFGFLALEAGWIVTEVGRQPWIIYDVMRTEHGVTPVQEVPLTLLGFFVLYLALGAALVFLLCELARRSGGARAITPEASAA
ncbi:MAG: cytochrome ubiquinol oxidase subunit I [Longimicrobiales bacterium]|nr:cytochrome ubiquinol oxidase subunit I [Longimicrobiales bacterium]